MPVEYGKAGPFWDTPADVRVNTVNCEGIMGAGVAADFREKYPAMDHAYRRLCHRGDLRPGTLHIWETPRSFIMERAGMTRAATSTTIVNFPTKDRVWEPSRLDFIQDGLRVLRSWLDDQPTTLGQGLSKMGILTVTMSALGCNNGGLNWDDVRPFIEGILGTSPHRIIVFPPYVPGSYRSQARNIDPDFLVDGPPGPRPFIDVRNDPGTLARFREANPAGLSQSTVLPEHKYAVYQRPHARSDWRLYSANHNWQNAMRQAHAIIRCDRGYVPGQSMGLNRTLTRETVVVIDPGHNRPTTVTNNQMRVRPWRVDNNGVPRSSDSVQVHMDGGIDPPPKE